MNDKKIWQILGAQWQFEENSWRPNQNQQYTATRVADVLEECCDEYLESWQDYALSSDYWDNVVSRLLARNKWWSISRPSATQVYKIAMTYIAAWDEKGRGGVTEDEPWGFKLGDLTWGNRHAEIDQDLLTQPWVRP